MRAIISNKQELLISFLISSVNLNSKYYIKTEDLHENCHTGLGAIKTSDTQQSVTQSNPTPRVCCPSSPCHRSTPRCAAVPSN